MRIKSRTSWRLAKGLVIAMVLGCSIGLTLTFLGVSEWLGLVAAPKEHDWQAYWNAGLRLRRGELLYPPIPDQGAASVYRYAPWFAVAWMPLTYLPQDMVVMVWVLGMYVASAAALWPLLSSRRWPAILLGAMFLPFLVQASSSGNVQPLIVAGLVYTIEGRGGPLMIGVAGSLKGFPALYAVRYLALRQWWRAGLALGIGIALASPILLFDLTNYPWYAGALAGLWAVSPLAWALGALVGMGVAIRHARSRAGWFSASVGVVLTIPRLLYPDMTFLLVTGRGALQREPLGAVGPGRSGRPRRTAAPPGSAVSGSR
jgi:hypothetical protein